MKAAKWGSLTLVGCAFWMSACSNDGSPDAALAELKSSLPEPPPLAASSASTREAPSGRALQLAPLEVASPEEPAESAQITFAEHIAPIVYSNCAPCHRPGEAAPFPLLSYEDARDRASQLVAVTSVGYMPPWLPSEASLPFEGERRLSAEELALLERWAEQGAKPGELETAPPPPEFVQGWQLGLPDQILEMPRPFLLRGDGEDLFRNFVFRTQASERRYVRAVEFRPVNARVIHHATLGVDPTPTSRVAEKREAEPGFAGMIQTGVRRPDGHLLGWVPGKAAHDGDPANAWELEPDADVVVQLHLQPSGKQEPVQPKIGLYFSDQPPTRKAVLLRLGSYRTTIPAGMADYRVEDTYVLPIDVNLMGLVPHAHYLARSMQAWAVLPGGERVDLLTIPEWDFNWQDEYRLAQPFPLPKGSAVTMRFVYDNSEANIRNPHVPPVEVYYGPRTEDEMADLWLQVLPADDRERPILVQDFSLKDRQDQLLGYREIVERDPTDLGSKAEYGRLLMEQGATAQALEIFEQVASADSNDAMTRLRLAQVLMSEQRTAEAIERLQEAAAIEPEVPEIPFNLGQALAAEGRHQEAIPAFRAAIAKREHFPKAYFVLGNSWMSLRRPDEAERAFKRAVELQPNYGAAWANLGTALGIQRRLDEAIQALERAIAIEPTRIRAHYNLGGARLQQGQTNAARQSFERVLQLDPSHAGARRSLASLSNVDS